MVNTEKELLAYVQGKENIWLFGAGMRMERYLYYCRKKGISIEGILVSDRGGNPYEKEGKPVLALDELKAAGLDANELNVLVTMKGGMKQWLSVFCEMPRFKSLLFLSDKLYGELGIPEVKYRFEDAQDRYQLVTDYPKVERNHGILIERESGQAIMRIPQYFGMPLLQPLLDFATREEFEGEFGPLRVLPAVKNTGMTESLAQKEKVEIYVVTSHFDRAETGLTRLGGYHPLQVGAVLTDVRKGCITDDAGDNISGKNRDYCECTGLYWIWKNTSGQNYVGLCHYRRLLMLDDDSVYYMKEHGVDVVAAHPQFEKDCVKDFFKQYIYSQDWQLLKQEVVCYDSAYAPYFDRYEEGRFYFPCNVALWRRSWFDRYCEFAFHVADRIETYYRERGILREDRYMGYLFEQLSTLFMMRHYNEMKIVCSQIEWVN